MSLCKNNGNMYPWVTHMHTHLGGECPHKCSYCYVKAIGKSKPAVAERYSGPLRLIEKEFAVNYGSGKTIFIDHLNDLWAEGVPFAWQERVLAHCKTWPDNLYVFQTKDPGGYEQWLGRLPDHVTLGVTIETNRNVIESCAPSPNSRATWFPCDHVGGETFITIEPIMDFDVVPFVDMIKACEPDFVNIGADSKGKGLPEPPREKVLALIEALNMAEIEIRQKSNLERLIGGAA